MTVPGVMPPSQESLQLKCTAQVHCSCGTLKAASIAAAVDALQLILAKGRHRLQKHHMQQQTLPPGKKSGHCRDGGIVNTCSCTLVFHKRRVDLEAPA